MFRITQSGNFSNMEQFLKHSRNPRIEDIMHKYGAMGVNALKTHTPVDTGMTSESWEYEIIKQSGQMRINWYNTEMADTVPVAILLQYGHATRNGGYVEGIDFINPALQPILEKMSQDIWREVRAL